VHSFKIISQHIWDKVVKLLKGEGGYGSSPVRVCAVGDGGNDVAMIQEAHVGIGILGREGRQAASAADFAVPEFQHLQKAILVHGTWNYDRLATLVMYFFYRAFLLTLPQVYYAIQNGYSGHVWKFYILIGRNWKETVWANQFHPFISAYFRLQFYDVLFLIFLLLACPNFRDLGAEGF